MTERETQGAKWFREDKARREKEAADALRAQQRKRLDALTRARVAQDTARQDSFPTARTSADDERALMERILNESDARARERLEGELRVLRERMQREAVRAASGRARRGP
ncbi:MAG: hypothetical protein EHM87_18550 [Burkholderiales bacterium]|nr:MAG: hypothetical protein EHM87_18550 [Burkholderiales bacterium]